jgi:hypothetical protein
MSLFDGLTAGLSSPTVKAAITEGIAEQNKKKLMIGLVVVGAVVLFFVLKRRR